MEAQVFYSVGDTIGAKLGGEVVKAVVKEIHEDLSECSVLQGRGVVAATEDHFWWCFRHEDIVWSDSASFRKWLKEQT